MPPMSNQTELESKVAKVFSKVLSTPLQNESELQNTLSAISLTPFSFSEDLPKVMVITMPLELLIYAKFHSKELIPALKKELPKYMIVMRRQCELPSPKVFTPVKAREEVLGDLIFPATISKRFNEVESREEMTQVICLDDTAQHWSKSEISSLEKLLCTSFGQNFKVRMFGTGF